MESRFGILEGVIRSRVGYAGGGMKDPSYQKMGDHTETVQIDYDPERITYGELLTYFWRSHDPRYQSGSKQYQNAIFFHDTQQHREALASKSAIERKIKQTVKTVVAPLGSFTPAEAYHQKYLLMHHSLKREILSIYPLHKDLVDSTAAARLNGYAGGYGTKAQLDRELKDLGLSETGRRTLIRMFPE
jgi:methionine-S-sulfoxide reductase